MHQRAVQIEVVFEVGTSVPVTVEEDEVLLEE
jgi:hypothetical protein